MGSKKRRDSSSGGRKGSGPGAGAPEFRNTALSDALQTQDLAAVAFALRHGPTVAPLMPAAEGAPESDDIWTYRDPATGSVALLLFSDAAHKPASLPPA